MYKLKHIGDVLRKKDSRENKDKIDVIDGKKYTLYFLYEGNGDDKNSNRAIAAASKFIKKSFSYYQDDSVIDLNTLIVDANRKILDLKLEETRISIIVLCVPKNDNIKPFFAFLGKSALYSVSYNQLKRINNKSNEKILGKKDLKKSDIIRMEINNEKAPVFICNSGFMELLANKRKDIIKILNQKDMLSARASMMRIMKARNFSNLSYILVKK